MQSQNLSYGYDYIFSTDRGHKFIFNGHEYSIDCYGYLLSPQEWDRNFAEGMAKEMGINQKLAIIHWKVIDYLRQYYKKYKNCPPIFDVLYDNDLTMSEFYDLFPYGFQKCACKISGLTQSSM